MNAARYQRLIAEFPERLRESERFHIGTGNVHQTVRELAADLTREGIEYAILGGMALNAHGYQRETTDVDVLVTADGLRVFRERLLGRGYTEAFAAAKKTFRNARTGIKVEFITSGEFPGDGKPKPVAFPEPGTVSEGIGEANYVNLPTLINLKLASGMTQPSRRRDLADVQELMRTLSLGAAFEQQIHPFVREAYRTLLKELDAADPHIESPG